MLICSIFHSILFALLAFPTKRPVIPSARLRKIVHDTVLGIIERALMIKRPVPASRRFERKHTHRRELFLGLHGDALAPHSISVVFKRAPHLPEVGLTLVLQILADLPGGHARSHRYHRLSALERRRFVYIGHIPSKKDCCIRSSPTYQYFLSTSTAPMTISLARSIFLRMISVLSLDLAISIA